MEDEVFVNLPLCSGGIFKREGKTKDHEVFPLSQPAKDFYCCDTMTWTISCLTFMTVQDSASSVKSMLSLNMIT